MGIGYGAANPAKTVLAGAKFRFDAPSPTGSWNSPARHNDFGQSETAMKLNATRAIALLAASCAGYLQVQAQTLLKGKDLNEKNLIEALSPSVVPAPETASGTESGEVRLRSIRPSRVEPSSQGAQGLARPTPPKKASASLLITFVTNSAELTDRARASLDVVSRALQADRLASFKFSIEGHADPRGDAQHNLRLSQLRADSVVGYLAGRHQISRDRLSPVGKGDTEPLNTRQMDAPENRRVTIVTLSER